MISSHRGGGGIRQNMTFDDKGGGGVHEKMTDDDNGKEQKVKDETNYQKCPGYKILQTLNIVLLGHILIILCSTLEVILISCNDKFKIIVYTHKIK